MKQQISGPMGAVILVIIVVIIAAIGWSFFKTPTNTGPTAEQRAAYLKGGGSSVGSNNQGDVKSTGPGSGATTPAPTTPAPAAGH